MTNLLKLKFKGSIVLYLRYNVTKRYSEDASEEVFCKGLDLFEEWTKGMKGVEAFKVSLISGFGKEAEKDTYGVGFYNRKETIYIFTDADKEN